MDFEPSTKTKELQQRLRIFMDAHVYPNEHRFHEELERERWKPTRTIEELKSKARSEGLRKLFSPGDAHGPGLTNLEYALLWETMPRTRMAPEVFTCTA